jgi:predicted transcriptional regulator
MPRKTPHITVTAVVSPAIAEELDRLAKANKVTRSTLIRSLLEEKLTERANERQEDAYDRLEKRLASIENRFGGLIVKAVKMSAQGLFLTSLGLQYGHQKQTEKQLDKHWDDAIAFAGKQVESKKKQGSQE